MTQYRVISENNLVLRAQGNKAASAIAAIHPGAIVHVAGASILNGYVQAIVHGWLGGDEKTIYCDSLARGNSSIFAVLYLAKAFKPVGVPDVYGRVPGDVMGWLALKYLESIE